MPDLDGTAGGGLPARSGNRRCGATDAGRPRFIRNRADPSMFCRQGGHNLPNKTRAATRARPCPVCHGGDGCSRAETGLILCRRRAGAESGFVHLGQSKGDSQYSLYREEGDSALNVKDKHQDNGTSKAKPPPIDWNARARACQEKLTAERRRKLADLFGIPEAALSTMPIGWADPGPHLDQETKRPIGGCWTFSEVDADGRTIGISCRYLNGVKKAWPDGQRGLTAPKGWLLRQGPVLCPEGQSDTLALTALGLAAVGRPATPAASST